LIAVKRKIFDLLIKHLKASTYPSQSEDPLPSIGAVHTLDIRLQ
jgi:hypothetical protein